MKTVKNQKTKYDNIVKIFVRWDSEKSIKQAEKDKLNLENKGYTQINSFGGINETCFVYAI